MGSKIIGFNIGYFDVKLGINITTENMDIDRFKFVLSMMEISDGHTDIVPYETHDDGQKYYYNE